MSDDIQSIDNALQLENQSLKSVIEQLSIEKQSWKQTSSELLEANISLKSAYTLLDKQLSAYKENINAKNRELDELISRLDGLEK